MRHRPMLAALLMTLAALPAAAQNLTITSAFDAGSAPFVRTEMVTLAMSGAEAFRPVTLFMGASMLGVAVTGATGSLAIVPASIAPFGPFDGLGVFGGGYPLMTDANGGFALTLRIPTNFGATLPASLRVQALVLRNPFLSPGGEALAFSTPADVVVDEPATSPAISNLSLHLLAEGSSSNLLISGSGFVPQATVLPEVFFTALNGGANAQAASVTMVDTDPGPAVVPALLVSTPAFIGAAAAPPLSSAGPVLVTVTYVNSALYPVNPVAGVFTTPLVPFAQPLSLIWQTALQPQLTALFPKATLTNTACSVVLNGANFLSGAAVDCGGAPALSATVLSGTQIAVTMPLLPQGVHAVVVRNPDHVAVSPRTTVPAPPTSDYVVFADVVNSISVTSITPISAVEGAAVAATITGTCAVEGLWSALDPLLGTCALSIGANIAGTDASSAATVTAVSITAPGAFSISAVLPALPAGLNPAGPTAGGFSNAGLKHVQVFAPACVNPSNAPHRAFTAIPVAESGNAFIYMAAAPPLVSSITPNNCARIEGGQAVTISGTGFFTNLTAFPANTAGLIPSLTLVAGANALPLTNVTMIDATTLSGTLPDATIFGGPLPLQVNLVVRNPDTQGSSGISDDFWMYPSLASNASNSFALVSSQLATGSLVTPVVYTFLGNLTLPAGALITAAGTPPLLIRCKGDVTIDGAFDLDAGAIVAVLSAAAAAGGAAATPATLGTQDPFQGQFGLSAFDPLTAFFYSGGGLGGFHVAPDAGGGGGGGMGTNGAAGLTGSFLGGPGGLSYGFPALPIPLLGSLTLMENFWPPGGSGGAAGGLGTPAPFDPLNPPPVANIGFNGGGGNAGGAIAIMADGTITITGAISARGAAGTAGSVAAGGSGGGGGGGSGGAILLQSIRGIFVNAGALLDVGGGAGGAGGTLGVNDGGTGSSGMIRCALPANTAQPALSLFISGSATVVPVAGTAGY